MDSNTQGFTSYWRNTLADAESGKGAFERKEEDSFTQWMNVEQGRLGEEIVQSFFEGEDEQVKTIWTDPTTVDKFCPHDEACSKASGLTPPR